MKQVPISTLTPGQTIDSVYLIQNIDQRLKKNSEPYFFITLQDATGTVVAMLWDKYEDFLEGKIVTDNFIRIKGEVRFFNEQIQITIKDFERVEESDVEARAFQQISKRDPEEMKKEFNEYINLIKDKKIKELVKNIFSDQQIYNDFCEAPASVSMHQAFIHGLLEHTLMVIKNSLNIADNYPKVNYDILLAGGILHDLCKIQEYSWKRTFKITDIGRLIGHIPLCFEYVSKAMDNIKDFDKGIKTQILHMILSHHGLLEYGSPKRPKTLEALILHYCDNMDAYISNYFETTDVALKRGSMWTDYNKMFERFLYAGFLPEDK